MLIVGIVIVEVDGCQHIVVGFDTLLGNDNLISRTIFLYVLVLHFETCNEQVFCGIGVGSRYCEGVFLLYRITILLHNEVVQSGILWCDVFHITICTIVLKGIFFPNNCCFVGYSLDCTRFIIVEIAHLGNVGTYLMETILSSE